MRKAWPPGRLPAPAQSDDLQDGEDENYFGHQSHSPFAGRVDREPAHQAPKVAASHLQVVAPGVGRAKVALPARLEALDVASQQGFAFGRAF